MKLRHLDTCIVDADNIFKLCGVKYKIDNRVKEYKVYNSYKNSEDFTNTAEMCEVKVLLDSENKLHFLDEYDKEINKITLLEGVS